MTDIETRADVNARAKATMGLGLIGYAIAMLTPTLFRSLGTDAGTALPIIILIASSVNAILYPWGRSRLCGARDEIRARRTWWAIAAVNAALGLDVLLFTLNFV